MTTGSRLDRLIGTYPELRAGRFAVMADFEDPHHYELFHLTSPSGGARIEPIATTNGHALRFQVGSGETALVIDNTNAVNWYLKRDWRNYDVLLLAIDSPSANATLRITVRAGPTKHTLQTRTDWPLRQGRNVVRLDLAELGESVPLDDIRALHLALDGGSNQSIVVDDLILTQDRANLLGDASATDGTLFVERYGRRWRVGSGGRFELTFAHGQVVSWYDLAHDPQRITNLLRGTALGPEPVLHTNASTGERVVQEASVSVRTDLIEVNEVRVVIDVERRRTIRKRTSRPSFTPWHWRYTIYPTGQLFVEIDTASSGEVTPGPMTLAVSVAKPGNETITTHLLTGDAASSSNNDPSYLGAVARFGDAGAALLFVPYFGDTPINIDERRTSPGLLTIEATPLTAPAHADGRRCAVAYLRLTDSATLTDAAAVREASWFHEPIPLALTVGGLSAVGDRCAFSSGELVRGSGAYALTPDRNVVRLTVPALPDPDFAPAFEILDRSTQTAWVYVEHRLHEPVVRNADGYLLFQTPHLRPHANIEVLIARPE